MSCSSDCCVVVGGCSPGANLRFSFWRRTGYRTSLPQALFAQPSVKAFYHRVLRGLAGLDVNQLDLAFDALGQEVPARQLRATVAANR